MERGLLEHWDNASFVEFLINPTSDPNRSSVIPDVDITLIRPDNSFPIHLPPFLMILGPPFPSILVGFCKIHNFVCFSSMKPCFMQDCSHRTGWDVWGDEFADLIKWFPAVHFGLANDRLLNMIYNLWRTSRAREGMCWASFFWISARYQKQFV